MINTINLPPFKRMCVTIGNLPTSFMESMSYYEALQWLYNYIDKEIIPAINTEGEAITELQSAMVNLKEYVDNYFENLDVQEEINNKLDDMAESGELADIIAQYLGLAGVLAFNTVAGMAAAENLVNGSICYCLGRNEYNDKYGYFYKIREITNSDVVDGINIVAITSSNDLIGELIDKYYVDKHNPIYYGADPTGTEDSTDAINNCILANKGGTINFSQGIYNVSDSINIPFKNNEKVSINGNGAKIVATEDITNLFHYGYDRETNAVNNVGFPCYIKDLFINCENANVTNAIYNETGFKDLKAYNLTIYRCVNGFKLCDSSTYPCDTLIKNCLIYGKGSEYDGTGIICNGTDNNINMSRIYGFRKGFVINGSAVLNENHVLLRWQNQTSSNFDPYERNSETFNTYYEPTIFGEVNAPARISNCYCDSMYKFLKITVAEPVSLINSWYLNARDNVNAEMIEITRGDAKININSCTFYACKNNYCKVIKYDETINNYGEINIKNNIVRNYSKLTDFYDPIKENIPTGHDSINMTAGSWYIIAGLGNYYNGNRFTLRIYINGYQYDLHIETNSNGEVSGIYQVNKSATDSAWVIGGFKYGSGILICVKNDSGSTGTHLDFKLENAYEPTYTVVPINSNFPAGSSRLLTDYTNDTPVYTATLKSVL